MKYYFNKYPEAFSALRLQQNGEKCETMKELNAAAVETVSRIGQTVDNEDPDYQRDLRVGASTYVSAMSRESLAEFLVSLTTKQRES
jgi:hypothetical protein